MKKIIKVFLIVIVISIVIIILDTLQARIFKNSPLISWKEELEDSDSWVDRGILIDTYYCTKEEDIITVSWKIKGTKYTCPIDNISYQEIMDKINEHYTNNDTDKSNIVYWTIDEERKIVIVGMMDISEEKQNEIIHEVFSNKCGLSDIQYIKDNKMIEFRESIDIFNGKIVETKDNFITVEVLNDSKSFKKGDKVTMKISRSTNDLYVVGNTVRITFNGMVETTNPPQIEATKIEIISE